jgi:hypothetical protein
MGAVAEGSRRARILAHLAGHPGATAGDLGRAIGSRGSLYRLLGSMQARAQVICEPRWCGQQGRHVRAWFVAPPGTVPVPEDRVTARRWRESDRQSQRRRRARARGVPVRPGDLIPELVPARPVVLRSAACAGADPALFFPADGEREADREAREAKAKGICAGCPVRAQCYAVALANGERWGIWGGVDVEALPRPARRRAS